MPTWPPHAAKSREPGPSGERCHAWGWCRDWNEHRHWQSGAAARGSGAVRCVQRSGAPPASPPPGPGLSLVHDTVITRVDGRVPSRA